jgi:hypothetical protein
VNGRLVIALVGLTVLVAACGRNTDVVVVAVAGVGGAGAAPPTSVASVERPSTAETRRTAASPTTMATTTVPRNIVATVPGRLDDVARPTETAPTAIAIEGVAIAGPVVPVGVDAGTGELEVPPVANVVGWYRHGPTPGAEGSAVLAGHVDWRGEIGVFFHLSRVEPGAVVVVAYADGSQRRFTVVERRLIAKPELPVDDVFARTGPPALVLITCGGEFDRSIRRYRSNVVVTALPTA